MRKSVSIALLIIFLLIGCTPAILSPTPTDFPIETSTPTLLPTATITSIPTLTATPEVEQFVPNVESLTCASKEDCLNGKYEIGPGGAGFYKDMIVSLLEGGWMTRPENYSTITDMDKFVDNEEFQAFIMENFGVDSNDPEAFMAALRERDYKIPVGLPVPLRDVKSAEHVRVQPAPAFRLDTIAIELLDEEALLEKTYPDEDGPEIKSKYLIKGVVMQQADTYVWGMRFKEFSDGETRLVLTVATNSDLPWKEAGVSPSDKEAIYHWENWLKFFPHLFSNAGHAVSDLKGGVFISIRRMINIEEGARPLWTGEYTRSDSSNSNILLPSGN